MKMYELIAKVYNKEITVSESVDIIESDDEWVYAIQNYSPEGKKERPYWEMLAEWEKRQNAPEEKKADMQEIKKEGQKSIINELTPKQEVTIMEAEFERYQNGEIKIMPRGFRRWEREQMDAKYAVPGKTILVNANETITVEVSPKYLEEHGKQNILADAMRTLGHQSEIRLMESEPLDLEAAKIVREENFLYEYLVDHCRYNLSETLMRMNGGHRMSAAMAADVSASHVYAARQMEDVTNAEIKKIAQELRDFDLKHSRRFADAGELKITILCPEAMPEQIGLCRYRQGGNQMMNRGGKMTPPKLNT